jgi:hypothetical protein
MRRSQRYVHLLNFQTIPCVFAIDKFEVKNFQPRFGDLKKSIPRDKVVHFKNITGKNWAISTQNTASKEKFNITIFFKEIYYFFRRKL